MTNTITVKETSAAMRSLNPNDKYKATVDCNGGTVGYYGRTPDEARERLITWLDQSQSIIDSQGVIRDVDYTCSLCSEVADGRFAHLACMEYENGLADYNAEQRSRLFDPTPGEVAAVIAGAVVTIGAWVIL